MQAPPGGVQIPQLSLQQISPVGHVLGPQGSPGAVFPGFELPPQEIISANSIAQNPRRVAAVWDRRSVT